MSHSKSFLKSQGTKTSFALRAPMTPPTYDSNVRAPSQKVGSREGVGGQRRIVPEEEAGGGYERGSQEAERGLGACGDRRGGFGLRLVGIDVRTPRPPQPAMTRSLPAGSRLPAGANH